jgi:flagellar hook-associated protein 1 FlgK
MASIFNALHIGYSGLSAAQVGIDTTGHNIANAEVEGYSRQRVVTSAATPLSVNPGNVGNGTQVLDIKRVFDNFVFDRYTEVSSDKEYSDYEKKTLEQLSSIFPEIDGVGVKADLAEYYNMWQTFADNPDNDAIKVALASKTQTLSSHIKQTQEQVLSLQSQINEELSVNINEVNDIAKELAELNRSIDVAEAGDVYTASDLRDRRNVLERSLSQLIGAEVSSGQLTSNMQIDSSSNVKTGSYTVNINGFNIVDGTSYHPIHATKDNNPFGFYEISYERQDGTLVPMEEKINGGKIGAILDLRGGTIDTTTGMPVDGIIQNTASELDSFARGLIESTNNLYAQSPVENMQSNVVDLNPTNSLVSSSLDIKEGSFELVVYDIDGNIAASRTIDIDLATSMSGPSINSIEEQIALQKDDNEDGNATNDIDDFFKDGFNFTPSADGELRLELNIDPLSKSKGYTFAINDNLTDANYASGTNFAGAMGMSRFFDGDSAKNIALRNDFALNPTLMSAGTTSVAGDNTLALEMVQHQFERFDFQVGNKTYDITTYGMFDIIATEVGTATNAAILRNETVSTQFNAIELEYFSTSKVSIDEEMTNLIKYQTSYGAAAKVITTIDQMMQTLLGIKQ